MNAAGASRRGRVVRIGRGRTKLADIELPGSTDRILDFSTAVTGGHFFAPSADFVDRPPAPPTADRAAAAGALTDAPVPAGTVAGDGSLGIGSLKG